MVLITGPLKPRLTVTHLDALDEPVLEQQLEGTVDARSSRGVTGVAQRTLDLDRRQGAVLPGEQLYHAVAGSAMLEAGAGERGMDVLAPVHPTQG